MLEREDVIRLDKELKETSINFAKCLRKDITACMRKKGVDEHYH